MRGQAEAIAYGATTIINAIATGKGAAMGVDLWTKARVELTEEPSVIKTCISSDPAENPTLAEKTVLRVLRHFKLQDQFGAKVETRSSIPIAKGLKSSSAAANAITLAAVTALGEELDDLAVVNLSVDAAIDAEVTITGAFDDACASYLGGIVVTDNTQRSIVKSLMVKDELDVLFHVPTAKAYTISSDVDRMKIVAPQIEIAYKEALKENFWAALTLNGLIYSSALGYDTSIAIDALMAGALAAGLSGKGPAVAAIVEKGKADSVGEAWQPHEGEIIRTSVNHEKAKVVC